MEIEEVHASLHQLIASLEKVMVAGFAELGSRITALADQQARTVEVFDERFSRLEDRLTSLESRMSSTERVVSKFEVRLTKMMADETRARTEMLQRWMEHDARLRH